MDFRVLGHLEVREGGEVLAIGGGRQTALLAALLVRAGVVVRTEQLVDWLWGDSAEHVTPNTVQALVSRLRRVVGTERLINQADGYRLVLQPNELDSERFAEQYTAALRMVEAGDTADASVVLADALQLWRGSPYADVADEQFVQAEIVRLDELHASARELRAHVELNLGRHAAVVPELEALVAAYPMRERPRALLMLALYRSGRQADALRVYRETRALLVDELGIEPGTDMQDLAQQILRQDERLAPPPAAPLQAPALPAQGLPAPETATGTPTGRKSRGRPIWFAAGTALVLLAGGITAVWASRSSEGSKVAADSIIRIDSAGHVRESIAVGERPGPVVFAGDGLWVANQADGTVSGIDVVHRRVRRTLSVKGSVGAIAAGSNAIWTLGNQGQLSSVSTIYDTVTPIRRVQLSGLDAFRGSLQPALAVDGRHIWIVDPAGQLIRLDPSGHVSSAVDVGAGADGVASDGTTVWVANGWDGSVSRVDPVGVATTIPVGHQPTGVAVSAHAIWVSVSLDDRVVRLAPETGAVVAAIPVGSHPDAIAVTRTAVWVASIGDGTVRRINPATNRVDRVIRLNGRPAGLAARGDDVWVSLASLAAQPSAGARGGFAHITLQNDVDSLDPALGNSHVSWEIEYATCAKLLNYPDLSGPAGSQLVPEVAESVPTPTNGGRTYTFTVRSGFRFAPPSGQPVTAAVFAHSIQRVLKIRDGVGAAYLSDIVGAREFTRGRSAHVTGMSVAGNRLTFRLTRPAGDFLTRLALPFACAVPLDTPVNPAGVGPIPSAGPYTITSYVPDQQLVLKRNPNYHGNRPRPLDEIDYRIGVAPTRSEAGIKDGTVDYVADGLTIPQYTDLARTYGPGSAAAKSGHQQFFSKPHTIVRYIVLNTHRPTFRDPSVRRAVAFAIDRTALAEQQQRFFAADNLVGGPAIDSLLPASMVGADGDPGYPLHPDVATARELMHGRRFNAVMYTCSNPPCPQIAQLLTRNLAAIGIRLEVRSMPKPVLFERASRPDEPYDLTLLGWTTDYPDPANVLRPLVDGSYIDDPAGFNLGRFNDSSVDSRLAAANRLTGPARLRVFQQLAVSIAEEEVPIIAYEEDTVEHVFSARMGCQVFHPVYFMDLASLCIRT